MPLPTRLLTLLLALVLCCPAPLRADDDPEPKPKDEKKLDGKDGEKKDAEGKDGDKKDGDEKEEEDLKEKSAVDLRDAQTIELKEIVAKFPADKPVSEAAEELEKYKKLALAIAEKGSKDAAFLIRDMLKEDFSPNPEIQVALTDIQREAASSMHEDSEGFDMLLRRLKNRKTAKEERVDLIYAARLHEGAKPDKILRGLLRDKKPVIVAAAMRALGARRSKEAVPDLLKLLHRHESKRERLWLDARQALTALTGYDMPSARDWKSKWKALEKDGFDPKSDRGSQRLWFPRNEIVSKRVVFVFDTSASMHVRDINPDEPEDGPGDAEEKRKGIKGVCSYCKRTHEGVDQPIERQRLWRGKKFMQTMLSTMGKGAKFNLVHFNERSFSWQLSGQFARVEDGAIQEALDYLEGHKPQGLSYAFGGIKRAFNHEEMDTIFYVSDGIATKKKEGGREEFLPLLAAIRNLNRHRGVRIFTVGFRGCAKDFMVKLARENGGAYLEID